MSTPLAHLIDNATIIDTHGHMRGESEWVENGLADVLLCLLDWNYVHADLISAGASAEVVTRALDGKDPDIEWRWSEIEFERLRPASQKQDMREAM